MIFPAALFTGLLLPSGDGASRRAVLQSTSAAALLPLLRPPAALAAMYDERTATNDERPVVGSLGALRSDIGPSIRGDGVEILVTDMSYKELSACPPGFFIPEKGGPWSCIEITATALNQGRQKKPKAAEVFGQLFDAEGFSALATALDPTQKSPMVSLSEPFPKGEAKQISFTVAVQARSPRPFRFAGFKAGYRNAGIEKTFAKFDPCEIDSSKCDDPLDQPDNGKALREGRGFEYTK